MEKSKLAGNALVGLAESIAMDAHSGQVDKAGEPYVTHPARVVQFVTTVIADNREALEKILGSEVLDSENFRSELYAIAWLHDVIEDSEWNEEDLLIRMIPNNVIDAVQLLSKVPSEPNIDYYERLKKDVQARIVKLADLSDNSNPVRLDLLVDIEMRERLQKKYAKAFEVLAFSCGEVSTDTSSIVSVSASD